MEDKSRLESLCKRFKVQLQDTKKMLAANKSAEVNSPKPENNEANQLNNSTSGTIQQQV